MYLGIRSRGWPTSLAASFFLEEKDYCGATTESGLTACSTGGKTGGRRTGKTPTNPDYSESGLSNKSTLQ
jgi:hypothetical protein